MGEEERPNVFPSEEERKKYEQLTGEQQQEEDPELKKQRELEAQEAMKRKTEQEMKNRDKSSGADQNLSEDIGKSGQFKQQAEQQEGGGVNLPPTDPNFIQGGESNEPDNSGYVSKESELPPHDLIPLPSEGKLYKNGKDKLRIAYLTAEDEDILTSPNLIYSGQYLETLINRKILDDDMNYRSLHVGDRNAILIWLRSTGYGSIYPVKINDPNTNEDFETEIDLNDLNVIELKQDPDENGYFDFTLPVSGDHIKFRLLTVGDIEDVENQVEYETNTLGYQVNRTVTYTLFKHLVEVNGNDDRNYINYYIKNMVVGDSRALRNHINTIESGIDMNVTVRTPGGESITTFLPIGPNFFWPDIGA